MKSSKIDYIKLNIDNLINLPTSHDMLSTTKYKFHMTINMTNYSLSNV